MAASYPRIRKISQDSRNIGGEFDVISIEIGE
jgi:hypothetical protein